LFISRIELDPKRNTTRRAISNPQVIHAAIEGCFPDKEDKDRKLWRQDCLYGNLYLLLLSPEKPDFSHFAHQFCSDGIEGETKDYLPLLKSIRAGTKYGFRLRANPTHSISKGLSERGKVYSHVTVEQKKDWLMKKAVMFGFTLNDHLFDVVGVDHLRFWRSNKERSVELGVAIYEGELEVTDSELFRQALTQGIGRAKAYGCGLLTVASTR